MRDRMVAYALKVTIDSVTRWWRASDNTWQSAETFNPTNQSFPVVNFQVIIPAGEFADFDDSGSGTWSVAVKDLSGLVSPYSVERTFTILPAPTQSITLVGIGPSSVVGSPGVSVGPVTIVPTSISSMAQAGAPTIAAGPVTLAPTGIATAEAFGAPAVQPGAITVSPTGVTSLESHGASVLTTVASLSPTGIGSTETVSSPVVTGGAVIILPAAIGTAEAFGVSELVRGTVSITPISIASGEAFGIARYGSVIKSKSVDIEATAASPTFARVSTAYRDDGTLVASGQPRFETGKFGRGIKLEQESTNLLTASQSSMSPDTNGWKSADAAGSVSTTTRDTVETYIGLASVRIDISNTGTNTGYPRLEQNPRDIPGTWAVGKNLVVSCWVKGPAGQSGSWAIYQNGSSKGSVNVNFNGAWQYVETFWTVDVADATIGARWSNLHFVGSVWMTAVQIENRNYDLRGASSWQLGGTTRVREDLSTPTSVLPTTEGSIEWWWKLEYPLAYVNLDNTQRSRPVAMQLGGYFLNSSLSLWLSASSGTAQILIKGQTNSGWSATATPAGFFDTPDQWHPYAVTWTGGSTFKFYRDGVLRATLGPIADPVTTWATNGLNLRDIAALMDGVFDDIRISNRALTDQEISDAYLASVT